MAEEQSDGIPSYVSNLFSILDGFQKNSQMEYFTVFWMDGWHDFSNCDGPTISAAVKFQSQQQESYLVQLIWHL